MATARDGPRDRVFGASYLATMNTGHQLLTRVSTLQLEVLHIEEDDLAPEGWLVGLP